MLALTPAPLQTAGERAFFAELARWDTGGAVRAAVVASLPLTDGPLNRRLSDAVLFVPEGVAVIRVIDVRQSGVLTASPEGAWTIGPAGRPGAVLQIPGGGSTPLDGLMRAGMDTAVRLRTAGLEPGRIARLTVLVGDVTGLVPVDGDLGEGDQVALLDTRSLLLGIARASRYTGVDNPRLWTTADMRAGLEALGLTGRGPVVEELNGEGFPYSPYVLRRPGLMAPAAMAAMAASGAAPEAPAAPVPAAAAPAPQPMPAPAPEPTPDPDSTRVGAAGGQPPAAAAVAPPAVPATPAPTRDTVAVDGPPSPPDDGGIGGLFAHGEQITGPTAPPRTSIFAQPPPAQYAPVVAASPSWGQATPVHESVEQPRGEGAPAVSRRTVLVIAAAVAVFLVLGVGGWLIARGVSGGAGTGSASGTTAPHATAGPKQGDVQKVAGVSYTAEAVKVDSSCSGHAYGQVATFLQATDCTGLSRALYSAQLARGPIAVSVIRVRMPDTSTARQLRDLADRNGSGNVSNLLREGVRYTGSPAGLANEEYASAVSGSTVTIVETAWADPANSGSATDIDVAATNGLALATPPMPGE
ncbi:MAG: hypothetical protein ACXVXU_06555 [Blastococcus sp.]